MAGIASGDRQGKQRIGMAVGPQGREDQSHLISLASRSGADSKACDGAVRDSPSWCTFGQRSTIGP
jgi:hypothetical protein